MSESEPNCINLMAFLKNIFDTIKTITNIFLLLPILLVFMQHKKLKFVEFGGG